MADFNKIVAFTKSAEGGLSRATTDSASKNASPCTYQGKTGWHTNKGITWSTFRGDAAKLGYDPSCGNFISMPDTVWVPIAKNQFWDLLDLDNYTSQAIANLMFSWEWGSGNAWEPRIEKYLASKGINWHRNDFKGLRIALNGLAAHDEKKTFDELVEQKAQFLKSLNQPANEAGWLNRLAALKKMSYSEIGKRAITFAKAHILSIVIGAGLVFGSITYLIIAHKSPKTT